MTDEKKQPTCCKNMGASRTIVESSKRLFENVRHIWLSAEMAVGALVWFLLHMDSLVLSQIPSLSEFQSAW